jgi:Two component regulator propeller
MRWASVFLIVGIGCGNEGTGKDPPDLGTGSAQAENPSGDMGSPPVTPAPQGGPWIPPPPNDPPVTHSPPSPLSGATSMLAGVNIVDVSTDKGGGIWAVSDSTVYYFPPGATTPVTYDQSNGLARGWHTWQDPYFTGTPESPNTLPLTFSAVAGANPGQAVVGNIGAIADRLTVDPKTGAIQDIHNLKITSTTTRADFVEDHLVRVIGTHKIITVLDGALNGTAYLGGWHGFYALHGLNGDCNCKSDFEEHQHYYGCDSSGAQFGCWDGDVWGLAMSPQGDVWAGDRHFVQLLQQRSLGPNTGLMEGGFEVGIDVFPGLRDEVHGLAVDAAGGVWVASDGNGLAYLTPDTREPTYWSAATTLPKNHLRGAALDPDGDLWIGTDGAGVSRYNVKDNHWTYYTAASGLADDRVNTVYVDQFSRTRRIFVATHNGVTAYQGQ